MEESRQQAEEQRRQKELSNAHKLAETAQARAKAERRGRLIGRWLLVTAALFIAVLSYNPIRSEVLRQQAMKSHMVLIPAYHDFLGDRQQSNSQNPDDYLIYQKYSVAPFFIDFYPVTNKRYGFCIRAHICSQPNDLRSNYESESNIDKPVANITAADAAQFCNWIGQLLPNDKEWELAAIKNKIRMPPGEPNTANFFYEWTRSPYIQTDPEWINPLGDPPNRLTKKGGSLDQPITQILTFRQSARSTSSDELTGFRCVLKK